MSPVAGAGVLATKAASPVVGPNGAQTQGKNQPHVSTDPDPGTLSTPGANKQKLVPVSGQIVAVDAAAGRNYVLCWDKIEIEIEIEVDGAVGGGVHYCKITGAASFAPV